MDTLKSAPAESNKNPGRSVLIVEDEVLVGLMLVKKLEEYGFEIIDLVGTGEEAIEIVQQQVVGAVLMDISLGGEMDGLEAAEILNSKWDVPVIFFTSYRCDDSLKKRVEQVGGLAVMDKLGSIEELVALLKSIHP